MVGLLGFAGLLASCSNTPAAPPAAKGPVVTVMTRNLYFGADLSPLFNATSDKLGQTAITAYQQMQKSDIPARLESVAGELARAKPDLVALQEAVIWSVIPSGQSVAKVQYDFVQLLLADTVRLGIAYTVASSSNGFSGALPVPNVGLVGLQDRDVILVRSGDRTVSVSGPASGNYQHDLTVTVAGIPIAVKRGWTAVDAHVGDRTFHVIATHLEAYANPTRDLQATELLALVSSSSIPTIVLGDVTSPAQGEGDQTYTMVRHAGLGDAWASARPTLPGYTCCRSADLRGGSLNQRIDMIFTRGAFHVTNAWIVGTASADRTRSGLWPSDHAGVVATLIPPA
jgi:endonuclease/exonuclease/phosphatase family metal-dependent hydrolase